MFPYCCYVHVFPWTIFLVDWNIHSVVFFSNFCFLVFRFFLSVHLMPMLIRATLISLFLLFLMQYLSLWSDASIPFTVVVISLPPSFIDTWADVILWIQGLVHFYQYRWLLVHCLSSSQVHFKNGLEYLTRGTAQMFIILIRFLSRAWFRNDY